MHYYYRLVRHSFGLSHCRSRCSTSVLCNFLGRRQHLARQTRADFALARKSSKVTSVTCTDRQQILILPLSLLRKIEALGFTSLLSLLPLGFLLILQIIFLGTLGVGEGVAMFKSSFFLALPIFVFAFSSQQAFFPIYNGQSYNIIIIFY